MTTKRRAPPPCWSGGAYADNFGPAASIPFPGFAALKAAFPVHRLVTKHWPAAITLVAVAQPTPLPAVLEKAITTALRDGNAVVIFAANDGDLGAGLAAIETAAALTDIVGNISGNRK
jgi:hypothetical protein